LFSVIDVNEKKKKKKNNKQKMEIAYKNATTCNNKPK